MTFLRLKLFVVLLRLIFFVHVTLGVSNSRVSLMHCTFIISLKTTTRKPFISKLNTQVSVPPQRL